MKALAYYQSIQPIIDRSVRIIALASRGVPLYACHCTSVSDHTVHFYQTHVKFYLVTDTLSASSGSQIKAQLPSLLHIALISFQKLMYKVTAYLLSERKHWPMFCLLTAPALQNMESIKAVLIEIKGRSSHDLAEMDR